MGGAACVRYSTWNYRIVLMPSRYMFFATAPQRVWTPCQSREQSCSMCRWLKHLSFPPTHHITFSPMRMTAVPAAVHNIPIFCINSESWTVRHGHLALLEAMLSHWSKGQPKGASLLLTIGIMNTSVFLVNVRLFLQWAASTNTSPTFPSCSRLTHMHGVSSKTPTGWRLPS